MQITIGVDISKDTLDAYRSSDDQHIQVTNDKAGLKALLRWIAAGGASLVSSSVEFSANVGIENSLVD